MNIEEINPIDIDNINGLTDYDVFWRDTTLNKATEHTAFTSMEKIKAFSVAPALYSGTFLFVGLMVAGLGCMDAGLCILSKKLKQPKAIILFVFSFFASLCMGYLSSRDFAQASMNWIAEGVNVVGQGLLLLGVLMLHNAGLAEMDVEK